MMLTCVAVVRVVGDDLCDDDIDGNCYRLHRSHMSWADANNTCSNLGFRLVAVQVNNQPLTRL